MTEWIINVNDGQEVLTNNDGLYDVEVVDAFNPFGDYARAFFDDLDGNLFDVFSRGTKVSFQYDDDTTTGFEQRFVGYVVNDFENDADGAEELEVEAYTFDQFLRGDEVSNDQTGNTIFEALQDVIQTDVPPVDWDASLVSVENDVQLTQSYKGDKVEDFLLSVRQKSAGEIFGVNENLTFFFERAEIERTRRDIDNTQWVNHDLGEEGGETKNQVVVNYDSGTRAVTVDNSSDQLEIQDNLGANGPAQEGDSITLEEITNIEDAIAAGEAYLQDRESTLTGTVTTFDLIDAQPSNVISVEIDPRGIDADFRIAENKIRWRGETNQLTLVEKKGADDDILIDQSKTLKRVENRPRDTDVIPDRVTDTIASCVLAVGGSAGSVSYDTTRVTNTLRNKIRDSWGDKSTITVSEIAVGEGTDRPTRSDTSLQNEVKRVSVNQTLPTDTSVDFDATFDAQNINEVGVFDSVGDLVAHARLSETLNQADLTVESGTTETVESGTTSTQNGVIVNGRLVVNGNLKVESTKLTVESGTTNTVESGTTQEYEDVEVNGLLVVEGNLKVEDDPIVNLEVDAQDDPNTTQGVITTNGQTATRDIIADNNPTFVDTYEFGNDGTQANESDTAISTVATNGLDDVSVQSADTTTDFSNITTIGATDPFVVKNGALQLAQSAYIAECENQDPSQVVSDVSYSGGSAAQDLNSVGDVVARYTFTTEYDMQANNWDAVVREDKDADTGTGNVYVLKVDGTQVGFDGPANLLNWNRETADFDLPAGQHTLEIELTQVRDDQAIFDLMGIVDTRFTYNFDNTVHQDNGYLDGPELYPTSSTFSLDPATFDVPAKSATVTQSLNDTSNNQSITLTPDGTTFNNTTTGTVDYGTDRVVEITPSVTLSRFPTSSNPQSATPRFGYNGQAVSSHDLSVDLRAIAASDIGEVTVRSFTDTNTADGSTFAEGGQLSGSTLITRARIPEFVKSNQRVISSERLRWSND